VLELGWWGDYTAEYVCREYFGFGKEPDFEPLLVTGGFIEQMWAPTLHQLAEVLGLEIERFEVVYETDGLDHDVETGVRHGEGRHGVGRALRATGALGRPPVRRGRARGLRGA
jgi:hypothetical protein